MEGFEFMIHPAPGQPEADAAGGEPISLVNPAPYKRRTEPTTEELLANVNRSLPFSDEAEKGVLSCILQDPVTKLTECREEIPVDAFYHVANRTVYEVLIEFHDRGMPLDIATLTHSLRAAGKLDKVGGGAAISELYTFTPVSAHWPFYKKVMMDKYVLRRMINACALNIHHAYEHGREHIDEDVTGVIEEAEERVKAVREGLKGADERTLSMTDCVVAHVDYIEQLNNGTMALFPIGIPSFDKRARGIAGDEYCLLTGPTKSGKTTLAQKIFKLAAIHHKHGGETSGKAAYYSGEVSPRTIGGRAIYSTEMVSAAMDRTGTVSREDQERYMQATRRVVDDMGDSSCVVNACGMTVEEMLSDMKAKWDTGHRLFVVDYIGKFVSAKTFNNREREISYMSNRLFDFTKRQGKPAAVICLAQLNDEGQVRDCRGLEHDCDMHLKIARVFKQEKGKEPLEIPNRRSLIVERGRSIESGYPIPIYFEGHHYKFEECTER